MISASDVFFDYHLLDIFFLVLLMYVWSILNKVNPKRLYIPKKDSRCLYPKINGGITEQQNLIIVIVVPIVVYTIIYVLMKCNVPIQFKPFDFLLTTIAHITCICLSNIIIAIIKAQVGKARPDFFDTLGSEANAEMDQPKKVTDKEFTEEFKSFASGHSTSASSGSIFLVLFLNSGINYNQAWANTITFLPLIYTFYIGGTRIKHHRHHTEDVLMGIFIGAIFPVLFFLGFKNALFGTETKP